MNGPSLSSPGPRQAQKRNRRQTALIVKFGQIGDVIMAIPAVRVLHEQGFEIHWVCGRAAKPLLECYSWIKVIPVDDRAIFRGTFLQRVRNILRLWSRVALSGYDFCATLYYDARFRLLTLPIRARRKIALSTERRSYRLLPGRHHTDEYLRVLWLMMIVAGKRARCPFPRTAYRLHLCAINVLRAVWRSFPEEQAMCLENRSCVAGR